MLITVAGIKKFNKISAFKIEIVNFINIK